MAAVETYLTLLLRSFSLVSIAQTACSFSSCSAGVLKLRRLPSARAFLAASVAATSSPYWANLKAA
jgi:hypothetical protein